MTGSKLPSAVQEFKAKQDYYRDVKLKGTVREEAVRKLTPTIKKCANHIFLDNETFGGLQG